MDDVQDAMDINQEICHVLSQPIGTNITEDELLQELNELESEVGLCCAATSMVLLNFIFFISAINFVNIY